MELLIIAAVILLISFVLSILLTPKVKKLAFKIGAIDKPSNRKVHAQAIPRLGGLAIFISFLVPVLGYLLIFDRASLFTSEFITIFIGAFVIVGVGIFDDTKGARVILKFAAQFGIAIMLTQTGFIIKEISHPFGGVIDLGILGYPITILWVAGIINAINLSDGLDGLAGGISLIVLIAMTAISFSMGRYVEAIIAIALVGSIFGFLRYNFHPAEIFMGDTGSLFLGYMLAVISIKGSMVSSTTVSILIPLIALGLPIFDTLFSMVRRLAENKGPFAADKGHIHHKILAMGFSHKQTVLVLYWICSIFGAIAFMMTAAQSKAIAGFILVSYIVVYILLRHLGYISYIVNRRHTIAKRTREEKYKQKYKASTGRPGFIKLLRRLRAGVVIMDILIASVSFYGALFLVESPDLNILGILNEYYTLLILGTVFFLGSNIIGGCYRHLWKYTEFSEIGKYIQALSIAVLGFYFFSSYLVVQPTLELNFFLVFWLLLFTGVLFTRISYNFYYNFTKKEVTSSKKGQRVVIYGAGDSGEMLLNMITKFDDLNYRPIGFIDDDPEKKNLEISRYRILGNVNELAEVLRKNPFEKIIVSTGHIEETRDTALRYFCNLNNISISRFRIDIEDY